MSEEPVISVFQDKDQLPDAQGLKIQLGDTYAYWNNIHDFVLDHYPKAVELWSFISKKYGWGYRLKDKRRAIIYLTPYSGYFVVTMLFGPRALASVYASDIDPWIKKTLEEGKQYPEGKVLRIPVKDATWLDSIKKLIAIKLAF